MYTSKIYLPIKCKVYLTKSMLQIWWNLTNSNEIYNTCTNNARAICFSDEISHLHLAELQSPVAVRKICWISLFLNEERKGEGKREILGLVKSYFPLRRKKERRKKEKYWAWLNLIFLNEKERMNKKETARQGLISFFLDVEWKGKKKEKRLGRV